MALAMGFLCSGCFGAAEDASRDVLPAPDPPGQERVLTMRDQTSTSKCIGRMETPLCAVETKIACLLRWESDLCQAAYWPDQILHWIPDPSDKGPEASGFKKYRVELARYATETDIPDFVRGLSDGPRAGDVIMLIHEQSCGADGCADSPQVQMTYFVRSAENRWRLIDWYGRLGSIICCTIP
jgi:hypothetical protein